MLRAALSLAIPLAASCLLQSVGSELFDNSCAGNERLTLLQREAAWSRQVRSKSAQLGRRQQQQELKDEAEEEEEAQRSPISKRSGEPEDHTAFDSYDKFMNSTSLVQSSAGSRILEVACDMYVPASDDGTAAFCNCQEDTALHQRPEHAPDYASWAMWRPSPGKTVLHQIRQHHGADHILQSAEKVMPTPGYNPSVIPLPKDVAAALHSKAHYLAVVRHGASLCYAEQYMYEASMNNEDTSVVIMDKDYQELILGTLPIQLQDFRLMTLHGKILATGNYLNGDPPTEDERWSWNVFEVKLKVGQTHHGCPASLAVEMKKLESGGMTDRVTGGQKPRFLGKNLGLFSDQNDELQVVYMLTNPVDVRHWTQSKLQVTKMASDDLRNNGSPIYLPELDAYLAVGHQYFHTDAEQNKRLYVHRFVVFDSKPPYKWIRASQPFCLPTISSTRELKPDIRKEWCEGRQFIMSWFRQGSDVIFSYGISDCEAAKAVLPLEFIINYTSTDLSWNLPEDRSAPDEKGEWDLFFSVPARAS